MLFDTHSLQLAAYVVSHVLLCDGVVAFVCDYSCHQSKIPRLEEKKNVPEHTRSLHLRNDMCALFFTFFIVVYVNILLICILLNEHTMYK